ncbi:MAG: hypothetical protein C0436_04920 [Alphaproteobacteria bacterium]|nr:hypothetical protein [Alphaproteobacteria bacterium]
MNTQAYEVIKWTQKPADGCGPKDWSLQEVSEVMCRHKPQVYMGWSYQEWYVKLLEGRLKTYLNR